MPEFKITKGYVPGSIGRVAELHGIYYHKNWNFGLDQWVLCENRKGHILKKMGHLFF